MRKRDKKQKKEWFDKISSPVFAFLCNFALVMVLFSLCRIFFYLVNRNYFSSISFNHLLNLLKGGIRFDLTALLYTNLLCLLMQIVPFKFRYSEIYQKVVKNLFVFFNTIAIIANCIDIPYFRFTSHRTTSSVFSEFKNEANISKIIFEGIFDYWYVALFFTVLVFILYRLYVFPNIKKSRESIQWFKSDIYYYCLHTIIFVVLCFFTVIGIRSSFARKALPIAIVDAGRYTNTGHEMPIVLNTPFCIFRTIKRQAYKNPKYFKNEEEVASVFSPVRNSHPEGEFKPLNVVIIILESFSKEFVGFFNKHLDNGTYKGYTPFLDSLLAKGLTFQYSYANGRVSRDAIPSILSSIPMFIEHFLVSCYSTDDVGSIASILKEKGYHSAFFHGAINGSMGFLPYVKAAGFDAYFGMDEYNNNKDHDGGWGIWDEEFLQFYADQMNKIKQPFITSVFTLSSHHPFKIPKRYEGKFPKGTRPMHQCIGYADNALRLFFEKISQYDWYNNTLFVLTADHTSELTYEEYCTDANVFAVPILFYHPGNPDLHGLKTKLIQQIDIMPSILGYLNYDKPYFAFGQNIFADNDNKFAVNYNNRLYQLFQHDYFLQFDGLKTKAIYNFKTDKLLKNNLIGKVKEQEKMETLLKAIIQQYIVGMTENKLHISEDTYK